MNVSRVVEGTKVRESSVSFEDHHSQARLFWNSMTDVEKSHIVEAFTFELGKCYEEPVKTRMLKGLVRVDAGLAGLVAQGLGLATPAAGSDAETHDDASPSLSQVPTKPGSIAGRNVGVIVTEKGDLSGVAKLREALENQGAKLLVISDHGGHLSKGSRTEVVERTFLTCRSIEFDALVVAHGSGQIRDIKVDVLLQEVFRHSKAIAAWGDGADLLTAAGIATGAPGVLVADKASSGQRKALVKEMGLHRNWDRVPLITRAS